MMAAQLGRAHERTRIAVPVELTDTEFGATEQAVTENVSFQGARVLVRTPKEPYKLLTLNSLKPRFRTSVRVVYCQRLPGDQFAVGLHLQGPSVNWEAAV